MASTNEETPTGGLYNLRKRKEHSLNSIQKPKKDLTKPKTKTKTTKRIKKTRGNKSKPAEGSDFSPESESEDDFEESSEEFTTATKKPQKNRSSTSSAKISNASTATSSIANSANKDQIASSPVFLDTEEQRDLTVLEKKIKIPFWMMPDQMRDNNGKAPHEEDYDPSTLYIPEVELDRMTGFQRQYWLIKKDHFDQMVAFKFGLSFFMYYEDALVCHKLLDLKLYTWGKRFSVFFHETHLKRFTGKLVDHGYKIAVVEQMESAQFKEEDYTRREVVQIITKGTYFDDPNLNYSPRFCLCLYENETNIGITFLDTTTHEFFIGEFKDDMNRGTLKTLLTRLKPIEIVFVNESLSEETMNICRNLSHKPVLNPLFKTKKQKELKEIIKKLNTYFGEEWPEALGQIQGVSEAGISALKKIKDAEKKSQAEREIDFYSTLQAISICLTFLERVMLAETVFKMGNFMTYDIVVEKKSSLYLDSQALESLEIFEIGYLSTKGDNCVGSLFDFIDHTKTDFGRRMMRRWVMTPLLDSEKINERLDAVEDLMNNPNELEYFQGVLKRLPDLERTINRVYNSSSKKRLSAVNNFEDFARNRLKDFLFLLDELEKIDDNVKSFQESLGKFKSLRLRQLISFKTNKKKVVGKKGIKKSKDVQIETQKDLSKEEVNGIFPSMQSVVKELKAMVTINEGLPMPAEGTNKDADKVIQKIKKVKSTLNGILEHERRFFGHRNVQFVHNSRRYELEVREDLVTGSKRPTNYVLTSKRKGFLRFQTPKMEECIEELQQYEDELQKILVDFIVEYFKKFYEHNMVWRQVVSCLSELDCLCGLAKLATTMKIKCRPEVLKTNQVGESEFILKGMVHPSLAAHLERQMKEKIEQEIPKTEALLATQKQKNKSEKASQKNGNKQKQGTINFQSGRKSTEDKKQATVEEQEETQIEERFVRNDIVKEKGTNIFLITGPNMGGKSTLLRQAALAVVLAQIGSMVPAHQFKLNAIDRIFTRIGAGDKIFEGKSTFFLEMEETSTIVKEATQSSFLIIDELGRGTSTYDGVSLAFGTLKYIAEKIKCTTFFATHYHILLEEFQLYDNVQKYFMASQYDSENEEIKFLYKFIPGQAERSHSFVVGKMAGLPKQVLEIGKRRAEIMTKEKKNMEETRLIESKFNSAVQALRIFKKKKEEINIETCLETLLSIV